MASKKKKSAKQQWLNEDVDKKFKIAAKTHTDDEDEEKSEAVSPPTNQYESKRVIGAFNMLAELNSDEGSDDNEEEEVEVQPKKVEVKDVKAKKGGKIGDKAKPELKPKAEPKGKGKKGKKANKEDEDLDALIADLEKPVEKIGKGKKKGAQRALEQSVEGVLVPQTTAMKIDDEKVDEMGAFDELGAPNAVGEMVTKKKDKKKKKKAAAEKEKSADSESKADDVVTGALLSEVPIDDNGGKEGMASDTEEAPVVTKKKDKKKKSDTKGKEENKKKKHVDLIKEILRKRQEEEERLLREQKEEEDRLLAIEQTKEEEERLSREKKEREKLKKKERDEKLKAEGKYLTPAQKEKLRRQQALFANTNIILPPALRRDGDEEAPTRRPVYGKKKQKKIVNKQEQDSVLLLPANEEAASGKESFVVNAAKKEETVVLDSWEATLEEGNEVVDDWEQADELRRIEEEKKVNRGISEFAHISTTTSCETTVMPEENQDENMESESEFSDESSEEVDEESSDDEPETLANKELLREKVRARLKKRLEVAEAKRSVSNLRAPVICVLGHVDTGKTKMLDTIRRTNVQDGEAGGITQQIGATQVPAAAIVERTRMVKDFNADDIKIPGFLIIDTPGHESFSNLRSRGSSLCDYAILVVDLMHGLEQQTLESLKLLRKRNTPFVIALNKIDRLYDYESNPRKDIYYHLKAQSTNTQLQFKELKDKVVLQFAEQGVNVSLANANPDPSEYISMVPTSAFFGDGIGNIMAHIVKESQTTLVEKLRFSDELDCTVMEVKSLPGLGTTIDVILVNGCLRVGDIIVLTGTDGAIMTQIRELLMPQPLKELRVKNAYDHFQMIKGAQGVKVLAKNLDRVLAGLPLFVAEKEDELEVLKEDCEAQLSKALMSIKKKAEGVYVQASTLGSLEALLEFLRTQKIPYSNVNIGPVHKRDVQKAAAMLERKEEYACILAFDVRVDREIEQFAANEGVRIFAADIIYHLEDNFLKYREELRLKRRREKEHLAIFPCKLRILPQHVFNARNPIVVGVSIEAGQLKRGVPLCVPSRECINLGTVSSIERNHEQTEIAHAGEEVCIKIENTTGEAPKLYARHFTHEDALVSRITRETIDVCKAHFRDDLTKGDWQLIVQLKKMLDIM